ncbi:MAG: hypothetical protein HDT21_11055, partial [Ruminococcus sp.]|nr:hypothetical protein [Ruminococcus sp.]
DEPEDPDPEDPDEPEDPDPEDPGDPGEPPATPPGTPNVPPRPPVPETPDFPVTSHVTPIIDFEMFDEPEVPLAETPFEDSFETFDDAPVPLADDPFGDADSYSVNPKTGVDMTVPMGAAAAAMASFMALMIANKKRRGENG